MASETSVVTSDRFDTGLTSFDAWMEAIPERNDQFQSHYDQYEPNAEDLAAVKALVESHGVKALTIGEHWCPDVWRGLPVMARISEATAMEHRIFFRDQNKDIMSEFLKDGEFESIPTIVFYDGDHNYLGHWIERPVLASEQMQEIRRRVMPNGTPPEGPERDAVMKTYRAETDKLAGGLAPRDAARDPRAAGREDRLALPSPAEHEAAVPPEDGRSHPVAGRLRGGGLLAGGGAASPARPSRRRLRAYLRPFARLRLRLALFRLALRAVEFETRRAARLLARRPAVRAMTPRVREQPAAMRAGLLQRCLAVGTGHELVLHRPPAFGAGRDRVQLRQDRFLLELAVVRLLKRARRPQDQVKRDADQRQRDRQRDADEL